MKNSVSVIPQKLWITRGRMLVPDGHPDASILLGVRGHRIPSERLAVFGNAAEFFPKLVEKEDPKEEKTETKQQKAKTK